MLYRLRKALSYARFEARCRRVWHTKPLHLQPGDIEIVSMLSHRDVLLYLTAIKTFYAQVGRGAITVIDDGTLTRADCSVLTKHLPGLKIIPVQMIPNGCCPQGGTWERLLYIIEAAAKSYVIQLDSDTLTLSAIPEVVTSIGLNRSFLLGTEPNQRLMSFEEASRVAQTIPSSHVQIASELALAEVQVPFRRQYVRACSGFAGFARGSVTRSMVEEFSREMHRRLASRWSEWGTEQVTSNVLLAQSEDSCLLPFPKYSGFEGALIADCAFYHFYGTHRFKGSHYADLARRAVPAV